LMSALRVNSGTASDADRETFAQRKSTREMRIRAFF
jgi:hypothetical protein